MKDLGEKEAASLVGGSVRCQPVTRTQARSRGGQARPWVTAGGGLAVSILGVWVATAGCSTEETLQDAPADAGAAEADDACADRPNPAARVALEWVAERPPAMTGGQVRDGRYVLVSATVYSGPLGPRGPSSDTLAITLDMAGTVEHGVEDSSSGRHRTWELEVLGTEGHVRNIRYRCGGPAGDWGLRYTATDNEYRYLRDPWTPFPVLEVYRLQ